MIDIKKKIPLGGFPQKIHIRGKDINNPVLLFLHGGPGISNRDVILKKHTDLQNDFTVVTWDQRGCGGSYKGIDKSTLTLNRLVDDAKELVDYLCITLKKDKVFIIGGSWGTELGTFLAYRYPDRIGAYVGYGQVVNGVLNEELSYKFAMDSAVQANDKESIEKLKKCGPPVNGQYTPVFEGLMTQRRIMKKYGGHSTKKGGYLKTTVMPILLSSEYSLEDKIGMIKGYKLVLATMWPTITRYNFIEDCNTFKMPYYIFQGRLDNNTPSALVEDFYKKITAPDKDLIWFENSAHGPLGEEPEKFKALLRQKLLNK